MTIEKLVQNVYLAQTQDPFQPYDALAKKPKVPEPSTYGAFMIGGMLLLLLYRRYNSNERK